MKLVTKRSGQADPIKNASILLKTINQLRGFDLVPKGVYRFKTFEEADRWLIKNMASTHARRSSKT